MRELGEAGLECGVEVAVGRIDRLVFGHGSGIRGGLSRDADGGVAGRVYVRPDAGADACQQGRTVGRAFGRIHGDQLAAQHVGQDLAPDRAARAAAGDAHLGDGGEPRFLHQFEAVAQAKGNAFEDGPGHVGLGVPDGEADKGPPGQWIGVGRALAGQIGQEEQALAARFDGGSRGQQIVIADVGRQGIPVPAQAAGRREHDAHEMPAPRYGVAEGVEPTIRLDEGLVYRGEDYARSAQGQGNNTFFDCADAHGLGCLVAAAGHDGRAFAQAGGRRGFRRDGAGNSRPFVGGRQPLGRDSKGFQHLGRPVARLEVEEQRAGCARFVRGIAAR